jgi:uncharacterized protein YndB with AHSA1/START domain
VSDTDQAAGERSTTHATFVIERSYDASPQRVFDAWADPAAKAQWWGPPAKPGYSLDLRVGGVEHFTAGGPDGSMYSFDALYQDVVPARRIIYSYEMQRDDVRISVSLACVEFEPDGERTRLTLTEHGVYLDGHDTAAQREHGTNAVIDALGEFIQSGGAHP